MNVVVNSSSYHMPSLMLMMREIYIKEMKSHSIWPRIKGGFGCVCVCDIILLYRSGALRARLVRLVQPATLETVQGIVKTLKDSFGFVERADMEKDVSL